MSHRFVQYNVLSPNLSSPSWYEKSPPECLDENTRIAAIFGKLEEQCRAQAIIGLQEIPLSWGGQFHRFFQGEGYEFIPSFYGNAFNGHMGVALAIPIRLYSVESLDFVVPAATMVPLGDELYKKEKAAKKAAQNSLAAKAKNLTLGLVNMLPFRPIYEPVLKLAATKAGFVKPAPGGRPKKSPRQNVTSRFNRAIFALLRSDDSDQAFAVGVYHMPCIYWDLDVMVMHTHLVADAMQKFAKDNGNAPHVLLGDFNIKPDDPAYEVITTGTFNAATLERVQSRIFPDWQPPTLAPLTSAYAAAGSEPEYTNHTFNRGNAFTGTLDYIFMSAGFEVQDVIETPKLTEDTEFQPHNTEPSDHILIGATLRLSRNAGL